MNVKKNILGVLGVVVFAMSRKCVNSPNFLYVYGEFTPIVKKVYELNFGFKVGDQTRAGHHIRVAVDVHDIYVAGLLVCTSEYLPQSLYLVRTEGSSF
jgi:hypothetical protein